MAWNEPSPSLSPSRQAAKNPVNQLLLSNFTPLRETGRREHYPVPVAPSGCAGLGVCDVAMPFAFSLLAGPVIALCGPEAIFDRKSK